MSQIQNEKEVEISKMVCFESAVIEKGVNESDLQDVMSVISKKVNNDEEEMQKQELLIAKLQALLKKVESKKQYIEQTSEYLTEVRKKKKEPEVLKKKVTSSSSSSSSEEEEEDENVKNSSDDDQLESDKAPLLSVQPTLPSFMGMEETGRIDFGDGGMSTKFTAAASASVLAPPALEDDIVTPSTVQRRKRLRTTTPTDTVTEDEIHFGTDTPMHTVQFGDTEKQAAAVALSTLDTSFIESEKVPANNTSVDGDDQEEEEDEDDEERPSSGKKSGLAAKRQILVDFALYDGKRVVHPSKIMEPRYVEEFYFITVHPRKDSITMEDVAEPKAINEFLDEIEPTDAQRAHISADVLLSCKNKPVDAVLNYIEYMIHNKLPIDSLWAFVNSLYTILLKRASGTSCFAFNSIFHSIHSIKRRKYNLNWERAEISECDKPKSKKRAARKGKK